MTLNSSGPISLGGSTTGQSVNLELGQPATAQISFNDAAVRTLTGTSANTALVMPTNFYGKSSVSITIPSATQNLVTSVPISSYSASSALFSLNQYAGEYGGALSSSGFSYFKIGDWITPSSEGVNYEAFATQGSTSGGAFVTGTFSSWVDLSSGSSWWFARQDTLGVGTGTSTITINVRKKSTTTVVGTFTVFFQCSLT